MQWAASSDSEFGGGQVPRELERCTGFCMEERTRTHYFQRLFHLAISTLFFLNLPAEAEKETNRHSADLKKMCQCIR